MRGLVLSGMRVAKFESVSAERRSQSRKNQGKSGKTRKNRKYRILLIRTEYDDIFLNLKVWKDDLCVEEDGKADKDIGNVWHVVVCWYLVDVVDADFGESAAEEGVACCEEGEGMAGSELEVAAHDGRMLTVG